MNTPIPWRAIKQAYIYDDPAPTCAALAERHGVSVSTVEKRCARDNWVQLRYERDSGIQAAVSTREVERRADALASMRIDSEEAIERARKNHRVFQSIVGAMNQRMAYAMQTLPLGVMLPDNFDVDVWIKANKTDADSTAKLHGIPQLVDVTDNRQQTDIAAIRQQVREYDQQRAQA
jgi:hypothetical protein